MALPNEITQITAALSPVLPGIPDAERREYLVGVMTLVYEMGLVEGKLQMLKRSIEEVRKSREGAGHAA